MNSLISKMAKTEVKKEVLAYHRNNVLLKVIFRPKSLKIVMNL